MTIKNMMYIHNLLVNAKDGAELKDKWAWEHYQDVKELYEEEQVTAGECQRAYDDWKILNVEYTAARNALEEFESQDWH